MQTEGLESDSVAVTEARHAVMGLLLHGDAAFAGQGVVAETLQLANTPGVTLQPCIAQKSRRDTACACFHEDNPPSHHAVTTPAELHIFVAA